MYNQDVKERFISEYVKSDSRKTLYRHLFDRIAEYEYKWGADICTRSSDEIQPVVNKIITVRSSYTLISALSSYAKWCINNNVEGARTGILNITASISDKLRTQTVSGPPHLQIYLNSLLFPESSNTADNIIRCYCWMAYGGMDEEDVINVKTSDVDLINAKIVYNDKEYVIYREALPAFYRCVNSNHFYLINKNYKKPVLKRRADSNYLLRATTPKVSISYLRNSLSQKSKVAYGEEKTRLQLSYSRIWLSGLFYKKYEMERLGYSIDFEDEVNQHIEGKEYSLKKGRTMRAIKAKIEKEYLEQYEEWKSLFN